MVCVVSMHMIAFLISEPDQYPILVFYSISTCAIAVILFNIWYRMFDSGTPYQVVNELGHLKIVVGG